MAKVRTARAALLDFNGKELMSQTFRTSKMHNTRKVIFPECTQSMDAAYVVVAIDGMTLETPLRYTCELQAGMQPLFNVGELKVTLE